MKLYATVTSERASKGQGGNKQLDITLHYEHEGTRLHYGVISLLPNGVCTYIKPDGSIQTIATLKDLAITTKGEKQKGDEEKYSGLDPHTL